MTVSKFVALPAAAIVTAVAAPVMSAAVADTDTDVVAWIDRHAASITSPALDPAEPSADFEILRGVVGDASVVGLGESTHGSHEQFQVKYRMVRFLVEELGFRTVAFEEDFASGVMIDRYVVSGEGDPRRLVAQMSSPFWAAEEILALVEWIRDYNKTHDDPVRFVGSDLVQLRQLSFDEVTSYVGEVAPERLDELNSYLEPLRLRGARSEQFQWYFALPDDEQAALIESARAADDLVAELPPAGDPVDRAYAEQHNRAIVGWYQNYAEDVDFRAARERFIADSVEWWRDLTGHSVVYWAANGHTSSAHTLSYTSPEEAQTGTFAGGHLEQRLGEQYVSIGTWFGHGAISSDYTAPAAHAIDPPTSELLEATLVEATSPNYLLPVPADAPPTVTAWLDGPSTMRMTLPSYVEGDNASDYTMTVPSLRAAFDALVFIEETTASQLLPG